MQPQAGRHAENDRHVDRTRRDPSNLTISESWMADQPGRGYIDTSNNSSALPRTDHPCRGARVFKYGT